LKLLSMPLQTANPSFNTDPRLRAFGRAAWAG
jgi:hypothetical protein